MAAKKAIKLVRMQFKAGAKSATALARLAKTTGKQASKRASSLVKAAVAKVKAAAKDARKPRPKKLSESERAKELREWNGLLVTVGIHSAEGAAIEEGTLSLAQIMTVHEFGSDDGTIPQRSWLRAWFDESQGTISALIKDLGKQVAAGTLKALVAGKRLGAILAGSVQRRWARHPWKELAESTLKRQPNRTPGSALTDTGQSRAAVSFQVRTADGAIVAKGRTV